jgi:hypothetical protein
MIGKIIKKFKEKAEEPESTSSLHVPNTQL